MSQWAQLDPISRFRVKALEYPDLTCKSRLFDSVYVIGMRSNVCASWRRNLNQALQREILGNAKSETMYAR